MTSAGLAGELSVDYDFVRPELSKIIIDGLEYDKVVIDQTADYGNPGQPLLPARGAQILLPMGTDLENVELVYGEKIHLGDGFNIQPAANIYNYPQIE